MKQNQDDTNDSLLGTGYHEKYMHLRNNKTKITKETNGTITNQFAQNYAFQFQTQLLLNLVIQCNKTVPQSLKIINSI